jgi:hypothetical protein
MAVTLFEMKRLSSGMAASLIGMSRVEFLSELHRYGVKWTPNLRPLPGETIGSFKTTVVGHLCVVSILI